MGGLRRCHLSLRAGVNLVLSLSLSLSLSWPASRWRCGNMDRCATNVCMIGLVRMLVGLLLLLLGMLIEET